MKNNSLHIKYQPDLSTKKSAERFRCTSLAGAKKAIGKKNKENIKTAVFTDHKGQQTKVK